MVGTVIAGGLSFALAISSLYTDTFNHSHGILDNDQQLPTGVDQRKVSVEQFVHAIETLSIATPVLSSEADQLYYLFTEASGAIETAEAHGETGRADAFREGVQNAIEAHMEKPGALNAPISDHVHAYSKYLTETHIHQANERATTY